MKTEVQSGGRGRWADRYPITIRNGAGEQIPPYAVVQLSSAPSVGTNAIYTGYMPTGVTNAKYVINSPGAIPVGSSPGAATDQYPVDALIIGSPTINQEVGPATNSWALSVSGKGFIYLGGLSNGVGKVASKGGTSSGDDFPLIRISNKSGVGMTFGDVCGYGNPVDALGTPIRIPTFRSEQVGFGRFCVLLNDIDYNQIGDAAICGLVQTRIDYKHQSHQYAFPSEGQNYLISDHAGPVRINWRERNQIIGEGTLGLQWAHVLIGAHNTAPVRAVSYSAITAASGSFNQAITPGKGQALIYAAPNAIPGPIGTPWNPANVVDVENWMFGPIAPLKPLELRPSRFYMGKMIFEVSAEGCKEVPS